MINALRHISSRTQPRRASALLFLSVCFSLFLLATPFVAKADITTGLVGHWTLNEGSGTSAADSAGSNTGTLTNGPTWTTGAHAGSGAVALDGGNDHITMGTTSAAEGVSALTVSLWAKTSHSSSSAHYLVAQYGSGNDTFKIEWDTGEDIRFDVKNAAQTEGTGEYVGTFMTDSLWHHIVGTYDGTNVRVYVDGVVGGSVGSLSGLTSTSSLAFTVGAENGGSKFWEGPVDDLRIYSRALSQLDVTDLYAAGTADVTAPIISSVASSTTATTATISWSTNETATSTVRYGPDTNYGSASTSASLVTSHSIVLTGLSPSTLYHFQVSSADAANNIATSSDYTFFTVAIDTTPPVISAVASSTATSTASITWTTDETADSQVEYGLTTAYSASSTLNSTLESSHAVNLTGLSVDTLYHFRVLSRDAQGNLASSTDHTFKTTLIATSTYYVDQDNASSSDANPGTELLPFRTIQKAADVVNPGDLVLIKAATYQNVLANCVGATCNYVHITRSGTSAYPIIFRAYGDDTVILRGFGFEDADLNSDTYADGPVNPSKRETLMKIDGDYIHVSGLEFTNCQQNSVAIDGNFNRIENSLAHDNWLVGILIGSDEQGLVEGNVASYIEAYQNRHGTGLIISRPTDATDILTENIIENSIS